MKKHIGKTCLKLASKLKIVPLLLMLDSLVLNTCHYMVIVAHNNLLDGFFQSLTVTSIYSVSFVSTLPCHSFPFLSLMTNFFLLPFIDISTIGLWLKNQSFSLWSVRNSLNLSAGIFLLSVNDIFQTRSRWHNFSYCPIKLDSLVSTTVDLHIQTWRFGFSYEFFLLTNHSFRTNQVYSSCEITLLILDCQQQV